MTERARYRRICSPILSLGFTLGTCAAVVSGMLRVPRGRKVVVTRGWNGICSSSVRVEHHHLAIA